MADKRIIGNAGLSILQIEHSSEPKNKKTAQEIAKWVDSLPMADTGAAAKKLFIQLSEITQTEMSAQERFSIMELLRAPNRTICTALKRHYIEQRAPLTEHKLIIANLRETLLSLMSDNYKLILEELHNKKSLTNEEKMLMATTIVRIYYYLNVLLICRYQLYTYIQDNSWHEVHLLYKYAKDRGLLDVKTHCQFATNKEHKTTVLEAYTHIILLHATDPYQWRQQEQHTLNKAIEMWALYPAIYPYDKIPDKKAGIYIIDLAKDLPPVHANFFNPEWLNSSCIAFDLANSVEHLKQILEKLQKDHLKTKIENPNDPEFKVTVSTLSKLINVWSHSIQRSNPRFPIRAQIKIVFSLNATYYYVNGEKEFNAQPLNLRTNLDAAGAPAKTFGSHLNLQSYEVIEEIEEETELDDASADRTAILSSTIVEETKQKSETAEATEEEEAAQEHISKELLYHIYNYDIENINPHGFCVVIRDKSYPPFQSGEIVAFKNVTEQATEWGIGTVRWLRRQRNEDFQIGIEIIAPFGRAAGIQMLRGDKPASRLSRCLILPEDKEAGTPPMLITTSFPIHSNTVLLYSSEQSPPIKATLTKEIDASGMYYQYVYSTEEGIDIANAPIAKEAQKSTAAVSGPEDKTNTEFDKIWGDL